MTVDEKIERLQFFHVAVTKWREGSEDHPDGRAGLRSEINHEKHWVRHEVIEAGCFRTITISPPALVGGLVMRGVDPFLMMFDAPYDVDLAEMVLDMVEEAIGVLRNPRAESVATQSEPVLQSEVTRGFAFIAMPMTEGRPYFDDALDAIKEAAGRCGLQAERVDEGHTTDRITHRVVESIERAEYVIADLTDSKPNVYFEAGYAESLGKTPV